MGLATSIACSGPSTTTAYPPSAKVASMSARRGDASTCAVISVDHRVGHRLVPGDQPGQAVGAVLGLQDHVDRDEVGVDRGVGDHHDLRRPGERRRHADPALAGHLALGHRHVHVARADDHVDRADRLGAVGHRGDGLRAADPVHLVDAGDGGGGQRHVRHPTVGARAARTARSRARRPPGPGTAVISTVVG